MKFCSSDSDDSKCFIKKIKSKRQQTIADREQELLELAEQLMGTDGFAGLTMDKLVAACSYSKGTVYNHFNSKEDLLCALCNKAMKQKLQLCRKAQEFKGNTRERCLAMHFAHNLHGLAHPTLYFCVITAKTPAVIEKSSAERLKQQLELETELTQFCDDMLGAALEASDIKLSPGLGIDGLSFANWAMSFGSSALLMLASSTECIKRVDTDSALLNNVNLLMDGMGWQPLSSQWDYMKSWQRIANEIFNQEMAALKV